MTSPVDSLRAKCVRVSTECTASQLRRAARAISRIHDHTIASAGLRGTQFNVLVALSLFGQVPLLRLADRLGLERTTLTRNLRPLERDGLVTSSPGPDQRVRLLRLTDEGQRALARAIPLWEKAQRHVVSGLGTKRWHELLAGLNAASNLRVEG